MKNKKMLQAIGGVKGDYIREADPRKVDRSASKWKKIVLAACIGGFAAMTALNLFLFTPLKGKEIDYTVHENSPYYNVILALKPFVPARNTPHNNFEKLMRFMRRLGKGSHILSNSSPMAALLGEQYIETTDNQVEGVIEGDLLKRSGNYAYYLHDGYLAVYDVTDGMESYDIQMIVEYGMPPLDTEEIIEWGQLYKAYERRPEMFLSEDGKTVTIIVQGIQGFEVYRVDVSEPRDIRLTEERWFSGGFCEARMVDGKLLIMSQEAVTTWDFDKESSFLPDSEERGKAKVVDPANVYVPEEVNQSIYTVVYMLDAETLECMDMGAVLSCWSRFYVSQDRIYFISDAQGEKGKQSTEIVAFSFEGYSIILEGSVKLKGWVENQYNLDQKDNILRVVTSTGNGGNLYCVNMDGWQVVAKVEGFGEEGENVTAVRFDGDTAYVCTAKVELQPSTSSVPVFYNTDPVFQFDLSDLRRITYKDTGVIPGFSSSLIQMGDGYLLGIGEGEEVGSLKVELYKETETSVTPVCSYEEKNVSFSHVHKDHYIDRENGILGLAITDGDGQTYYLFLRLQGETLESYKLEGLVAERIETARALITKDLICVFTDVQGNAYPALWETAQGDVSEEQDTTGEETPPEFEGETEGTPHTESGIEPGMEPDTESELGTDEVASLGDDR